jgi:hypothetical protein
MDGGDSAIMHGALVLYTLICDPPEITMTA